nr:hypothetical protein [uncultured Prevotella sp.]
MSRRRYGSNSCITSSNAFYDCISTSIIVIITTSRHEDNGQ